MIRLLVTFLCLSLLFIHGCSVADPTNQIGPELPPRGKTYVFNCTNNLSFTARATDEGSAWLFLPPGTKKLPERENGLYRDNEMSFSLQGGKATLEMDGNQYTCENNRRQAIWEHAKLNGANFRAIGNEPGWHMEIRHGSKMILVTDYGSKRLEINLPEAKVDKSTRATVYRPEVDGGKATVTIKGEPCSDSMSGESFESRVSVETGQQSLNGCGRALH